MAKRLRMQLCHNNKSCCYYYCGVKETDLINQITKQLNLVISLRKVFKPDFYKARHR